MRSSAVAQRRSGGHVARRENAACGHTEIAYNSCRNPHRPKRKDEASRRWLADRERSCCRFRAFMSCTSCRANCVTWPARTSVCLQSADEAAAETTLAIAADSKRLGASIGVTGVLHAWGSALTHHPHVHMIVPGGGLSLENAGWIVSRSNFLVHVNILARLLRGKMLAHAHACA